MTTQTALPKADLWTRWRLDRDVVAREQLAGQYLGYARVVAATYYGKRFHDEIDFADYYQFACVGLMEALDRFDPEQGVQFKTFAGHRMRGAILDGLERMTEKQQQIAARARLRAQRLHDLKALAMSRQDPGQSDGAKPAGGSSRLPAQVLSFVAEVGVGLALSWLLEGTGMVDTGPRSENIPFYRSVELKQLRQRLLQMVEALPKQERKVIRGHYLQNIQLEEIATHMGLTRGRISQIHRQAIERLRIRMRAERLVDVFW